MVRSQISWIRSGRNRRTGAGPPWRWTPEKNSFRPSIETLWVTPTKPMCPPGRGWIETGPAPRPEAEEEPTDLLAALRASVEAAAKARGATGKKRSPARRPARRKTAGKRSA